jgi:hypothetical protein
VTDVQGQPKGWVRYSTLQTRLSDLRIAGLGEPGFATEVEGDVLDGSGLWEVEQDVPRQQGRFWLRSWAFEIEDIVVDHNFERKLRSFLISPEHVRRVAEFGRRGGSGGICGAGYGT